MSASGNNGYDNQTRDNNSWKKPGDTQVPEADGANGTDSATLYFDGSYQGKAL
jgi:hypothetical protein